MDAGVGGDQHVRVRFGGGGDPSLACRSPGGPEHGSAYGNRSVTDAAVGLKLQLLACGTRLLRLR